MLENTLQQIGLSDKQAKIYMACLELGECSIKDIARKAEIKRTTIYDIIGDMVALGFVRTTFRGSKKRYIAAEPKELQGIIRKRETLLEQIIPQLNSLNNSGKSKPKIWFHEGKDGLREVYKDTLNHSGEIIGFASEHIIDVLGRDWAENYLKKRTAQGIRVRAIMPKTDFLSKEIIARDQQQLRMTKTIDPKKYPFSIEVDIYGKNKVALISSREETAMIIEGEEIFNTMKLIFELLWDLLPEIDVKRFSATSANIDDEF